MTVPVRATYRVQLSAAFTLDDARAIVPYLARLGISHIYASPVLRSRPGSTHGYDVVDPTRLDPELGSDASWRALVAELRAHGMGIVLDIVPNHMGVGADNPFWDDLFANGPASRYASWFDIDWNAPARGLKGRVLIPILGDELDAVIARGEIALAFENGRYRIHYFDHSYPLDPATMPRVMGDAEDVRAAEDAEEAEDAELAELAEIVRALSALPPRLTARRALVERRQADGPDLLRRLDALSERSPRVRSALERAARDFVAGEGGVARLRSLLDAQVYALVFWRRAAHEINYRRFFDINELVALRMEDPSVFGATHRLIVQWVKNGELDGLRIDHVDGLRNPRDYLARLRGAVQQVLPESEIPVWVEKILSRGERLRDDWPIEGTTGYEFLAQLEALFIDPNGLREIERHYRSFLGIRRPELDFREVALRGKGFVLRSSLASDVQRLARLLARVSRRDARTAELTRAQLAEGIVQLIAQLAVYRTYIEAGATALHPDDRAPLAQAFDAVRAAARMPLPLLELLEEIFLNADSFVDAERRAERDAFVLRFQQTSGPATAKGIEDTALYRYSPLLSMNEVGADPSEPIDDAAARLHAANGERRERWPRSMLATTTHDTKRSADVRARIDVLSEIPAEWARAVSRWERANRAHKTLVQGRAAPDAHTEYVLYQTLVGVWPMEGAVGAPEELASLRERVTAFAIKAAREAKARTSWTDPNERFEQALTDFISALFANLDVVRDIESFARSIAASGARNSIARMLVHLTAPGIPDTYQGDELWNLALVDPDNRRAVDYARGRRALGESESMSPVGDITSNSFKLFVLRTALQLRAQHPALFASGTYEPLTIHGRHATHLFAFLRSSDPLTASSATSASSAAFTSSTITLIPRLTHTLPTWSDTTLHLPSTLTTTRWRNVLTGAELSTESRNAIPISEILTAMPFALLASVQTPN
jgi:(1->4)-alpha-D-glucan 1-alpha-D-glucosylmutase